MTDQKNLPRLIIAASETDADLLYRTRFFVPDASLLLEKDGHTTLLLSSLEVGRGRKEALVDEVLSTEPYRNAYREENDGREPTMSQMFARFLEERGEREFLVPSSFPLGLAEKLRETGITLHPVDGLFYPERERKAPEELEMMRQGNRLSETGILRGYEVLGEAGIDDATGMLTWQGEPLTSEVLRAEIDSAVLRAGGMPANTIAAGGEQACDPHQRGSGQLFAGQLIILDVFPRHVATGYFGDLTRTVLKGRNRATEEQKKLWEVCLEGQKRALDAVKPGVEGLKVQEDARQFFADKGYPTREVNGNWTGFFHGLGHGLGLEVHELPRISHTTFQPGQVFTIEPGLYYPGIGGVRHEDVVAVTEDGYELLDDLPKPFVIE